jgi:leader peptidase (prepilin peptidase)/N-methyltransferase
VAEIPAWFVTGVAVALGLAFGSFINVVIYRVPRGMSLVRPGSACPHCGRPIRFFYNVPLFGWLLLGGRARCCGRRVSWRYPALEALSGLLAWAIVETKLHALPPSTPLWTALLVFSLYLALGLALLTAAFIDIDYMYVPDAVTLGGAMVGLASSGLREDVGYAGALVGAVAGYLVIWLPFDVLYRRLRGKTGMAMGDAKLVMLAGAWFGIPGALFALMAGSVQGTVFALVSYLVHGSIDEPPAVKKERRAMLKEIEAARGTEREELIRAFEQDPIAREPEPGLTGARIAFGPFLALATIEYMLFGPTLIGETLGIWV